MVTSAPVVPTSSKSVHAEPSHRSTEYDVSSVKSFHESESELEVLPSTERPVGFDGAGGGAGGSARLVARDGFDGEIFIGSDGKLEMFAGGSDIALSGNGVINESGYAANCMIWCTSSVTSIDFSGNAEITAAIYAPWADLSMNGGGHSPFDYVGSLVVNSANLNGIFSFHYDEALKSHNKYGRYILTSWNEL